MSRVFHGRFVALGFLAFLGFSFLARAELDLLAPWTASVMIPDCVISRTDRKSIASIEISFTGNLVVTGSDGKMVDTSGVAKRLSIRNHSPDEAGAFDVFCDRLEAVRGKSVFLDISTKDVRTQGSGVFLEFSRSHCEIR